MAGNVWDCRSPLLTAEERVSLFFNASSYTIIA